MIDLPSVTLAAYDGVGNTTEEYLRLFDLCSEEMTYGDKVLVTADKNLRSAEGIKIFHIDKTDYIDFNIYLCTKMGQHINTSHMLFIQEDGYVLNPSAWQDEFLQYDYIGTPWLEDDFTLNNLCHGREEDSVAGGGFSMRSKKFLDAASVLPYNREIAQYVNEDYFLCGRQHAKPYMLQQGIKYAPLELAKRFGLGQKNLAELFDKGYIKKEELFGFHGMLALESYLSHSEKATT
jgi:hypothetical protein